MIKKNYISILLFGALLALFALTLQFFEYKYHIGRLNKDIYTSVVATIFTAVGIWIGINLLKKRGAPKADEKDPKIESSRVKELNLNNREYEILQLISQGLSNKEIADQLFLALPTIKTHTSNLYSKLDVKSRTQAVHKAKSMNLI